MHLKKLNVGLREHCFFVFLSEKKKGAPKQRVRLIHVEKVGLSVHIQVRYGNKTEASFAHVTLGENAWEHVFYEPLSSERSLSVSSRAPLYTVDGFIPEHVE